MTDYMLQGFELVYETTLIANATSITINALNGDTADEYKFIARIINGSGSNSYYTLLPNNDVNAANYKRGLLYNKSTNLTGGQDTGALAGFYLGGIDTAWESQIVSHIGSKSGVKRTSITNCIYHATTGGVMTTYSIWANTADNITSLVLSASTANALGIGTNVQLWRKRA